MSELLVFHNHQVVGRHDPRCEELLEGRDPRWHRRHEGNVLVVVEDGREIRYEADQWSAADVDLVCGFMLEHGPGDCERCVGRAEEAPAEDAPAEDAP